jgi:hypothetical protein
MRMLALVLVGLGAFLAAGCNADNPNNTFWWNSRLVPITPDTHVVSGTGATVGTPVSAAPTYMP